MSKSKSLYKENFLFWLMFKVFVFIWLLSTVIFIAFCNYYGVEGDGSSIGAYMNLLVFDATIFAPIAAYFFYDNWKEQHNQNVDSKYYSQALENFKKVSNSVNNLKRLHDEYCDYPKDYEPSIEFFQKMYKEIRKELQKSLADFQGDLVFLQRLSENQDVISTLEKFHKDYINVAKGSFSEDPILFNFYNSYTDHEQFKEDLYKITDLQGSLIIDNLNIIVQFLNSKIKA